MTSTTDPRGPAPILENTFLDNYFVPRHGCWLVVTSGSCFKLSRSTKEIICSLPARGTPEEFLEELRALGVPEAEKIFARLVEMKCLVRCGEEPWYRVLLRRLRYPSLELITSRVQDRAFFFLKGLEIGGERLFRFAFSCCLFGLVLSAAILADMGFPAGNTVPLGTVEQLLVLAVIIASILLHELGHSVFAHLNGIGFRPIGFSLYLMYPVFYANVSGIGELPLKHKMSINLAGLAMQSLFLGGLLMAWAVTSWPMYFAAVQSLAFLLLFNLNPLLNTDGYWCYKDLVAAYKDSRLALLAERIFGVATFVFTLYLLYGSWLMLRSVLTFVVSGRWTVAGSIGALVTLYILFIVLRGLWPRIKESLASVSGASLRPAKPEPGQGGQK